MALVELVMVSVLSQRQYAASFWSPQVREMARDNRHADASIRKSVFELLCRPPEGKTHDHASIWSRLFLSISFRKRSASAALSPPSFMAISFITSQTSFGILFADPAINMRPSCEDR